MCCSTCCSACLHVCLHNLIASQRTSSMCGSSWPLKDNFECFISLYLPGLEFTGVKSGIPWSLENLLLNHLAVLQMLYTAGSLALHVGHPQTLPSKHHSSGRNHPRPPGYAASYSWQNGSSQDTWKFRTKVEVSCQRFLPAWSHWKPAGIRSPKLREVDTLLPGTTHLLELLFGAQEFSPSTFLAPKK